MVNTIQQVGGSIGTALLTPSSASAVTEVTPRTSHPPRSSRPTRAGRRTRLHRRRSGCSAAVFVVGAIVVGLLMHSIKIEADASPEPTGEAQLARS